MSLIDTIWVSTPLFCQQIKMPKPEIYQLPRLDSSRRPAMTSKIVLIWKFTFVGLFQCHLRVYLCVNFALRSKLESIPFGYMFFSPVLFHLCPSVTTVTRYFDEFSQLLISKCDSWFYLTSFLLICCLFEASKQR